MKHLHGIAFWLGSRSCSEVSSMCVSSPPPNGGAPQPAVQELAASTSFSTSFSVSAHRPWLRPPDVLPRALATLAAGGLLRTFASCSSGSREQRVPPDMKRSAMVSGETPRCRILATDCSCNIWSHESAWRPTLGVSRLCKQMQQQCRLDNNHNSAPATFDQLSEVLSACSTVPYHCHPRMRGSRRTQASD